MQHCPPAILFARGRTKKQMAPFNIELTAPWPAEHRQDLDDPRLVGQSDRCWLIPLLHSTLAAPSGVHRWPHYNKVTGLSDACAYWETAYYLLGVLLGWSDVGLGLKRLYDGKRPAVESPHLDLLEQVWNDRSQLDLFAMWAWERNFRVKPRNPCPAHGESDRTPDAFRDRDWYAHFLNRYPGYGIAYDHDPYHGGTNPLHLGHALGAFDQAPRAQLLRSSPGEGLAVLLLDGARGWATALDQVDLPPLVDRSWHVDVVVRPLGWLGTFRRSRVTDRWFVGKHSVHMLGFA